MSDPRISNVCGCGRVLGPLAKEGKCMYCQPQETKLPLREMLEAAFTAGFTEAMSEYDIDTGVYTIGDAPWSANIPGYAKRYADAALESAKQPEDAVPLFGLAPFIADVIRDELRECDHDEWTPESLAEEILKRLRDEPSATVQSKDSAQHFTLADDATIQSYPSSRSGYMTVRFVDDDGTDIKVRMPKPVHATLCEMLGSAEQANGG